MDSPADEDHLAKALDILETGPHPATPFQYRH
jgi:hypothetical protein